MKRPSNNGDFAALPGFCGKGGVGSTADEKIIRYSVPRYKTTCFFVETDFPACLFSRRAAGGGKTVRPLAIHHFFAVQPNRILFQ
jgi:hypothetical protein